ncbi:MAG: hypothetical protein KAW46_03955, partial [candidate division Zixibacteria bacterium]|nr:hypothetical protein [candidate division Zixibacteria bacterium]
MDDVGNRRDIPLVVNSLYGDIVQIPRGQIGNVSPISNVVHGEAKVELVLDADDKQELPLDFSLAQNYPNPF